LLCGVLLSTVLVLTVSGESALAFSFRDRLPLQGHAISPSSLSATCRHRGRAASRRRSECRSAHAAQVLLAAWSMTVTITSGPAAGSTSAASHASFGLRSTSGARFECQLDSGPYSSCTSPAAYQGLANGRHTFRVYATMRGVSGHVASVTWTVATAGPSPKTLTTPASVGGAPPLTTAAAVTLPPAPTGLVATPGNAQVSLSWRAVTDSAGISAYRVLRNESPLVQLSATSYTDTGLTNGTTYSYTVEAVDSAGKVSPQSAAVAATAVAPGGPPPPPQSGAGSPPAPLTSWVAAAGGLYTPPSDQAAAADVTAEPETRPGNSGPNNYVPSAGQLAAFYSATNPSDQTTVQTNPYYAYVTGDYTGTTDDIIQWAAWKWGIPADWLRAEYVQESNWSMSQLGDEATVSPAWYAEYPAVARIAGTDEVYQSMGISQIKWAPDGSVGAGTEPLRWESTAFNADYEAATLRFYYDNPDGLRSAWGDSSYVAGEAWNSLGGWFSPYPWGNPGQLAYIAEVQAHLAARTWAQPGF
jgi:hypothetical protein